MKTVTEREAIELLINRHNRLVNLVWVLFFASILISAGIALL